MRTRHSYRGNRRRRSTLQTKSWRHCMTSLGHVTWSRACRNDSPWTLFYRLSIGTIPSSGFVSEIISPKLRQRLLRDDVIGDVINTTSLGEHCRKEAFYIKIMTSPLWRHGVTWGAWPIDNPWALSYYTHWNNYNICKLNYQHIGKIQVCVGDRWGVVGEGAHNPPPKNREKYFFGQLSRKIRAFC